MFEQNWQVFSSQRPHLPLSDLKTKGIERFNKTKGEDTIEAWEKASVRKICFDDQIPRDDRTLNRYKEMIKDYSFPEHDIGFYYDSNIDHHQLYAGIRLRDVIKECSLDPNDILIKPAAPISTLLCFGTGSGNVIDLINTHLAPINIIVIVSCWSSLISSFNVIHWPTLHSQIQGRGGHLIISRISDEQSLLGVLAGQGLITQELTYTYFEPCMDAELTALANMVNSQMVKSQAAFTGFTTDEYNMVINSTRNLSQGNRIIRPPALDFQGQIAVCASGPSLDKSIHFLKEIQKTHLIIAAGSCIQTLLENEIRVDILCLLERGSLTYSIYSELSSKYNLKQVHLCMSVTCDPRLPSLFKNTVLFFRPALTPLSIYADSPQQVLSCEGPQVANTAYSFASLLKPESIVLVGVDLGARYHEMSRSSKAAGHTPRVLNIKHKGNLCDEVFTSPSLIDCKTFIESMSRYNTEMTGVKTYNISDGLFMSNTISISMEKYKQEYSKKPAIANIFLYMQNKFTDWYASLAPYGAKKVNDLINARNIRHETCILCDNLVNILAASGPSVWPQVTIKNIEEVLQINESVSLEKQVPRRLIRGCILKTVLGITQQLEIMKKHEDPALLNDFIDRAASVAISLVRGLESEIYSLITFLEKDLHEIS